MPQQSANPQKTKKDGRARKTQETSKLASLSSAYPFAAIVGQDEMKLALLLSVIDPAIGGVIIMGHRGTGKSTAVRALANLLPPVTKVKGCLYGCDPKREAELCDDCAAKVARGQRLSVERALVAVVDLPLGATEDRVCGTLDIERALVEGAKVFEPGLLARANRGFLYIDEVNLLEDHLVDVLLDSAASGRNVVEREGISISHPARFVLVGSGNPEEGELRPQLLDRFGLFTQIETIADLDQRVEIVQRREEFERDPASFIARWELEHAVIGERITRARKLHPRVAIDRGLLVRVAKLCLKLKVDGHRGELTIARASRALAALESRATVTGSDVRQVATMSLRHRLRRDPLERIESSLRIAQAVDEVFPASLRTGSLAAIR
jgi:magnesium chelatase subunit I